MAFGAALLGAEEDVGPRASHEERRRLGTQFAVVLKPPWQPCTKPLTGRERRGVVTALWFSESAAPHRGRNQTL